MPNGKSKIVGLVIDEYEASIIRQVYEWYLVGGEDGEPMTMRASAHELSRMEVPTPGKPRKREEFKWFATTVKRMFNILNVYVHVLDDNKVKITGRVPLQERVIDLRTTCGRLLFNAANAI